MNKAEVLTRVRDAAQEMRSAWLGYQGAYKAFLRTLCWAFDEVPKASRPTQRELGQVTNYERARVSQLLMKGRAMGRRT